MKAFDDAIQMGYSTLSRVRSMRVRQLCCRKRKHAPRRSKATTEPVEHLGRRRWLRQEIFRGWDVIVPRRRLGFPSGAGSHAAQARWAIRFFWTLEANWRNTGGAHTGPRPGCKKSALCATPYIRHRELRVLV